MSKQTTRQHKYEQWYHAITRNPIKKDVQTRPAMKTDCAERDVLKACIKWLRSRQCVADRNNVGMGDLSGTGQKFSYGIKGGGDIMVILPPDGKHVEIECKSGKGGRWTVAQQARSKAVRRVGGLYFVVHSVEELAEYIEPLLPGLFGDGR